MRAVFLNATLKRSPADSSTAALCEHVAEILRRRHAFSCDVIRLVDRTIAPGVVSEAIDPDDEWPEIRSHIVVADVVVFATPTWLGQPSSVMKRALERMDAMLSERRADGVPIAFNRVAGFIVVGNEDGAHHCIAEMTQAVTDIGFTVPGQAWTYWNKGPGPGDEVYLTTRDREWTHATADAMAHVVAHAARALAANPIPKPPNA